MRDVYAIEGGTLRRSEGIGTGSLVILVDPSADEIDSTVAACDEIDQDDLLYALDDEELSRLEAADGYTMLVLDVPVSEPRGRTSRYQTYPVGIFVTDGGVTIVVSLVDVRTFHRDTRERPLISPSGRPHYVYELLMSVASAYQGFLREIERTRKALVDRLDNRASNDDLLLLHGLETDIVYFETSLSGNRSVLERAARSRLAVDEDDRELFADVIVEMTQASEMAHIYQQLVAGTRDLLTNVMNNDLSVTMKVLTSLTVIMAVPTIVSGFYGMNVDGAWMPLSSSPHGFAIVLGITTVNCAVCAFLLHRRNML
jgi:magnesium transporter